MLLLDSRTGLESSCLCFVIFNSWRHFQHPATLDSELVQRSALCRPYQYKQFAQYGDSSGVIWVLRTDRCANRLSAMAITRVGGNNHRCGAGKVLPLLKNRTRKNKVRCSGAISGYLSAQRLTSGLNSQPTYADSFSCLDRFSNTSQIWWFPLSLVTTTQYMETRGLLPALRTCLYELPPKSQQ